MTKTSVKNILIEQIDNFMTTTYGSTDTISQSDLTSLTDILATTISNTVNPNGPCYPSTPR